MNRRDALKTIGSFALAGSLDFSKENSAKLPVKIDSAKFEENKKLVAQWENTGLLKNIRPEHKLNCAMLLQNQVNYNELPLDASKDISQQRRVSIPGVVRFFGAMQSLNLFGVNSVENSNFDVPYIAFDKENNFYDTGRKSYNTKLQDKRSIMPDGSVIQTLKNVHLIMDAEAELLCIMVQELGLEFDRHILSQAMRIAATRVKWDFAAVLGETIKERADNLLSKVTEVSSTIFDKTMLGPANWIMTCPVISAMFETMNSDRFSPVDEFEGLSLAPRYCGEVIYGKEGESCYLYKDPLFPRNKILVGRKETVGLGSEDGRILNSGLVFCPRLLFADYSKKNVVSDYELALMPNGESYYAVIEVENFI